MFKNSPVAGRREEQVERRPRARLLYTRPRVHRQRRSARRQLREASASRFLLIGI